MCKFMQQINMQTHAFAKESTGSPVSIVFQWLAGYVVCEISETQPQFPPAVQHQAVFSSPDSETSVWARAAGDAALHPDNTVSEINVTPADRKSIF